MVKQLGAPTALAEESRVQSPTHNPVPVDLSSSSDLSQHQAHTKYICTHADKTLIHIK